MAKSTYVALDKKTVGSAVSSVEFTTISNSYTHLVVQIDGTYTTADAVFGIQFNGDTTAAYSDTDFYANGSTAGSYEGVNTTNIQAGWYPYPSSASDLGASKIYILNYANTSILKTTLEKSGMASGQGVYMRTGRWNNTNAISSIKFTMSAGNFAVGTVFSLYGILAEGISPAPKATGGAIFADDTYYYHVFGSSGAFVPSQSLTASILNVGGGGSGGLQYAGGGGAGGISYSATASLNSGTTYTCTVGAGAPTAVDSGTRDGSNGSNSSFSGSGFSTLTATGGGLGGGDNGNVPRNGGGGGCGGGGSATSAGMGSGGAGSQGFNGAAGVNNSGNFAGGGGGGMGEAGNTDGLSNGGDGTSTYSSWVIVTGAGEIVNNVGYLAGGGGGSTVNEKQGFGGLGGGGNGAGGLASASPIPARGKPNTGGGGGAGFGGAGHTTTSGGSGVVIVRYAKV
jgi:hypothetical protein